MKKFKFTILSLLALATVMGCADSLNVAPKQVLDESLLTKPSDMEGFVTAAYARITDIPSWDSPFSPWWTGSLRSDDSYKGGGGTWDGDGWHNMEIFVTLQPNGWPLDYPWYVSYQIIQRCNTAIQRLNTVTEEEFPDKNSRIGEVTFLRAFTHFRLKQFFKYIPYIDENVVGTSAEFEAVANRDLSQPNDQYLWERLLADFKRAEELLPPVQTEKGRIDKNAATAMVARILMFMAYEQDDRNQVTNVNKERLSEALTYLNKLTDQEGAKVGLQPDFAENFDIAFDNNTKESIWEIQYSIDDGSSSGGKINRSEGLNHPFNWGGYQCCGFHQISYTMANAFKTGPDGLPLFDTYNGTSYADGEAAYFEENTFDPRFSHTVAAPGLPWKYVPNMLFEKAGIRNAGDYGYFKSIKELVPPDCDCLLYDGWQFNSMNKRMIRYDEVLLWKAEVLIQLDRWDESLPLINKIRERAANSTDRLVMADGTPSLDYHIEPYKPGVNCEWTKEFAWKAMQWENRLEMAAEGRRFFDLQRWGILEETMNDYFEVEKDRFSWMGVARFTAGRDEYFPIPQPQINWAKGNYTQNVGY
ncbi:RagB/SusD family nutrient uptake outer membrane protein [Parapedobacter sp. 2B3]|uniref:RagB/SusD family nutrient uptake outer membrane protein n=1 Tax=Parapedobacter sp. 2B3 TaxID=3342381 RepID=UPI0035B61461